MIDSLSSVSNKIEEISIKAIDILKNNGTIFGNGGSASDSQHLAAELVGRFEIDRLL